MHIKKLLFILSASLFAPIVMAQVSGPCPAGMVMNGDGTSCGYQVAQLCPAGTELSGAYCVSSIPPKCPAGSYQDSSTGWGVCFRPASQGKKHRWREEDRK